MPNDELPVRDDVVVEDMGFDLQSHQWTQQGHTIMCPGNCRLGVAHGHSIPAGMQINKKDGEYYIEQLY